MEQGVIITLSIMYAGWIGVTLFYHGKKIAVLESNRASTAETLNKLVASFSGMETKFDLFLKSELDTLKEISKASTDAINKMSK